MRKHVQTIQTLQTSPPVDLYTVRSTTTYLLLAVDNLDPITYRFEGVVQDHLYTSPT